MARGSGENSYYVFRYGLPMLREQIQNVQDLNAYGWGFAEIARAAGPTAGEVFQNGLPAVAPMIENQHHLKRYGLGVVAIGEAARTNIGKVFAVLPGIRDLIATYGIDPFVKMAQTTLWNTPVLFDEGLARNRESIAKVGIQPFVAIVQACGLTAGDVLKDGLPAEQDLVQRFGVEPFVQIAELAREATINVFKYGIAPIRSRVNVPRDVSSPELLREGLSSYRESLTIPHESWVDEEELGHSEYGEDSFRMPVESYVVDRAEFHGLRQFDPDADVRRAIDTALRALVGKPSSAVS
jgi:hypothetical protein